MLAFCRRSFLSCKSAEEWLSVHNPDLAILDIMLQSFAGTAANANRPAPGNRRPLFRFGPIGRHVVSARVNGSSGSSTLDQAILASPLGAISTLPPDMSRLAPAKLAAASSSQPIRPEAKPRTRPPDLPAHWALSKRDKARAFSKHTAFPIHAAGVALRGPGSLTRLPMLLSTFSATAFALALIFAWVFTPAEPLEAAHVRS